MNFLKKITAGFLALTLCTGSNLIPVTSATTIYGDVNNDGIVDVSDVTALNLYLSGAVSDWNINKKYSDVDQNTVIDVCDLKTLQGYLAHSISSLPYSESGNTYPSCNNYFFPGDSTRSYTKYNCSTGATSDYTLNQASFVSMLSGNSDDRLIDSGSDAQSIVYLKFDRGNQDYQRGTGFIVDKHIIATCAHCLYNGSSFNTDFTISIMNENGTEIVRNVTAKELHVPNAYISSTHANYDYGLIYVEENLSRYGKIALGTTTQYFLTTSSELDISGFPREVAGSYAGTTRYYGTGTVKSTSTNFLIETTAYASGGDSGGPIYIPYTINGETFRSAVGICCGYTDADVRFSGGVRITTPVLRFYMYNNNIGSNP